MFSGLKHTLRRRVFGKRFQQQLFDDHQVIGRLANQHYFSQQPSLIKPEFQAPINAYEFSYFSQNGEDGLILHLLSRAGVESRFVIEVGTEDGRQCNSANLILNFGWSGCLIEGAKHHTDKAKQYFQACKAGDRVQILNAMTTPENINGLLQQAGVPKNTDVLSIDIDSYDYWLWQAVDVVNPRIVVIEYNASFGPNQSVTVPYQDRQAMLVHGNPYYHGASITALTRLGQKKGYVLVGGDNKGINCFFVRSDLVVAAGLLVVEPDQTFRPHFWRSKTRTVEQQYQAVAHLPLVEIE